MSSFLSACFNELINTLYQINNIYLKLKSINDPEIVNFSVIFNVAMIIKIQKKEG